MSFSPFSPKEIEAFCQFMEKKDWSNNGTIEDSFRYSIHKNQLIILTLKIPIKLPIRLNIPFELLNFKISMAFKVWNLSQSTYDFIFNLITLLRHLYGQISINSAYPIKGKETELVDLLNLLIPELTKEEREDSWNNRIRISLMNKRSQGQINPLESERIQNVINSLQKLGLSPTFNHPWELKKGVPKLRTTETLFFSNEENFDEFYILERGFHTYFKDFEYNKFFIRVLFESYSVYIINELFKNSPDFTLEILIENWIKFSRLLLNSVLEIISNLNLSPNDLAQFNPEHVLINEDFEIQKNNFPFSALYYESSISKELFKIHHSMLNKPPTAFEIVEQINFYTEAEDLIKNYKFTEATALLNDSLKLFNKYKQKNVVVSILLLLRRIANLLNQHVVAINYLKIALGVAKSGDVTSLHIINIHYKLAKKYYELKNYGNALNHLDILNNILNSSIAEELSSTSKEFEKERYVGMVNLYKGMILLETNKLADAKPLIKNAFKIASENPQVNFKYHLMRAVYFKNKANFSQMSKLLKAGLSSVREFDIDNISKSNRNTILDMALELIEYYIHSRKDSKKANNLINQARKLIDLKEIAGLRRAIRWNLLTADFYKLFTKNPQKYQLYLKESRILKARLKEIGVLE